MLRFDSLEEVIAFALGCGPVIEVLAPDALRGEVAGLAAKTAQLYATVAASGSPPTHTPRR